MSPICEMSYLDLHPSVNVFIHPTLLHICDKRHSSCTNGLKFYVEKQLVAWRVCCVEYWWEKARKRMSRWTGRSDMTEKLLKNGVKPKSINKSALAYLLSYRLGA